MPRSLRARLLLAVGIVVAASFAAMGLVTSIGTEREFNQFLEMETEEVVPAGEGPGALVGELEEHYRDIGSWDGVAALLQSMKGNINGRDLLLLDTDGVLIASSDPELRHGDVRSEPDGVLEIARDVQDGEQTRAELIRVRGPFTPVRDEAGAERATLHLLPGVPSVEIGPPQAQFLRSANRWLWAGLILGGVLALGATAAVARRILGPVEELTGAARRMAGGDLAHRVEVNAADEVGELARAFNGMADSLERNERLRRQMVSDIAHDLRTPLTNIRGQLEAIQDGLLQATPEIVASLHDEVMFLSALVTDLQDLSLAEAGQLRLELRPLSVADEIGRVIAALRPGATGGPELVVDIPELPVAQADPGRFRQVVRNLLINALAHTPADGRIVVQARESSGEIEVIVQDNGSGIAPEHLPHVFERFYRADPSRGRTSGGAGLGLAIVKQLVSVQKGRAWVDSSPGEGARFGFTVPRAVSPGAA
jgi:signal transduction histidine kinase